jgi:hypothetical protein
LRWQLSLKDSPEEFITFHAHQRKVFVPHWASRQGIDTLRLEATNDKGDVSYASLDFAAARQKIVDSRGSQ